MSAQPENVTAPDGDRGSAPPEPVRRVLVTGATGYVGRRLVPRLLAAGYDVRTTVSDRKSSEPAWWSDQVTTVEMDITDADQVDAACAGVDALYFLVHGMGGDDFAAKDRQAAQNVADAVAKHGIGRVVYLSGIVPPVPAEELSEHIASRLEVERLLSASPATVITLRAAVVMGSGSTSFEIIRQVSERLPVQTIPDWMNSCVQPIAVVDVVEALLGALTVDAPTGHYDVGGPTSLPYGELLDRYAELAGLTRPQVVVPFLPTDLVGVLVGAMTDVPDTTVRALVESLHHDMVAADDRFRVLLPPDHDLLGLDDCIQRSLAPERPDVPAAQRDPMGPMPQDPHWASGGDDRPFAAKVMDTARAMLPGDA